MKLLFFILSTLYVVYGDPDLPGATSVEDLPPFEPGSLIIPMDNSHQCRDKVDGCTSSDVFNVKVYGLIERLSWLGFNASLYSDVPLLPATNFDEAYPVPVSQQVPFIMYWAIREDKGKDDVDFSATVTKVAPCFSSGSSQTSDFTKCSGSVVAEDFRASAIIIRAADALAALKYIDYFNNKQDHIRPAGPESNGYDDPIRDYSLPKAKMISVYQTTQRLNSTQLHVRHVLSQRPYIGVMDSVFFRRLLVRVLNQALWEPAHRIKLSKTEVKLTHADSCYTILLEPHFEIHEAASPPDASVPSSEAPRYDEAHLYTSALHAFVAGGGNLYAQCHGIDTYENLRPIDDSRQWDSQMNPMPKAADGYDYRCVDYYHQGGNGAFMSTHGFSKKQCSGGGCNFEQSYHNHDLPISQFEGTLERRSIANLELMRVEHATPYYEGPREGTCNDQDSDWEPYSFGVLEALNSDPKSGSQSGTNDRGRWWKLRSAKYLRSAENHNKRGGIVTYFGGHAYGGTLNTNCGATNRDCSEVNDVTPFSRTNSQRILLNAALIPSRRPPQCKLNVCDLITCPSDDCYGQCVQGIGCVYSVQPLQCEGPCGQFTARFQEKQGAGIVYGNMYYDVSREKIAYEYYDPVARGWTGDVAQTRVNDRCALVTHVFACETCTTLVDKKGFPRYFVEDSDIPGVPPGVVNPTGCPMSWTKVAPDSAVKYLFTDSQNNICGAIHEDGKIFTFWKPSAPSVPGVDLGAPTFDFDAADSWNCPAASCDSKTELVFVIDEQAAIPGLPNFEDHKQAVATMVTFYREQGFTKYGAVWTNAGSPVNLPAALTNSQASFLNIATTRIQQRGTTRFAASILKVFETYWTAPKLPSEPPRRLVTVAGGPDTGSTAAEWTQVRQLLVDHQVDSWVLAAGSSSWDTQLLSKMVLLPEQIVSLTSSSLLHVEAVLLAARTCPANDFLCEDCNGWCCCKDVCCCPDCEPGVNLCQPFTCDASTAELGCVGDDVYCPFCDKCDPQSGTCVQDIGLCNDTNACTQDVCVHGLSCINNDINGACNDNDYCTDDSCDPDFGCVYIRNWTRCPPPTPMPTRMPTSLLPTKSPSSSPSKAPTVTPTKFPTSKAPSSATPTSRSPTSKTPTSKAPSSATPTSETPTSKSPTSRAPSSARPTSDSPTSRIPTSRAPSSATPTSKSPTSKAPTRSPGPTSLSPSSAAPTSKAPSSAMPTSKSPTSKSPTSKSPSSAVPTSLSPTSKRPTSKSPTSAVPTSGSPTSSSPTSKSPTSRAPSSGFPTSRSPTSKSPTSQQPSATLPTLAPTSGIPTVTPTLMPTTAAHPCEANPCPRSPLPCFSVNCVGECTGVVDQTQCVSDLASQGFHCNSVPGTTCRGTPCTSVSCVEGIGCVYGEVTDCSDGNPCTEDFCDITTGNCTHSEIQCSQFNKCVTRTCNPATGLCESGPRRDCDDGLNCTTDSCSPTEGCVHVPIICNVSSPCFESLGCFEDGRMCVETPLLYLFDFCGNCLGDNVACFFSSLEELTAQQVGLTAGILVAIAAVGVVALLGAAFVSKRAYDIYQAKSELAAAGAHANPLFKMPGTSGSMPVKLTDRLDHEFHNSQVRLH